LPLNGRDFSTLLLLAAATMNRCKRADEFHPAVRHTTDSARWGWFAMDGADVSDPEMGGDVHEFRCGRDSGITVKLGLDAGGHRARCGGLYQYRDTIRKKTVFTDHSSSS